MANLANAIFLLAGVLFVTIGYKTGWAIYVDPRQLSPQRLAAYPTARRIYIASMVLSFVSIIGLIGSFTYHALYGVGPETTVLVLPAAVILLVPACVFGLILRKM